MPEKPTEPGPGVSWLGLIGGVMGFAPLAALAVGVLIDPPGAGRGLTAVPALMASVYLPAIWASVTLTDRRQVILRGSVIASMVLAFVGVFLFGLVAPAVLAPGTALLWVASGGFRPAR